VLQSSGSPALDRAGVRAVRSIRTLHPLPTGIAEDSPFEAWLLFARDERNLKRMQRSLSRSLTMAQAGKRQQVAQGASSLLVVASR
jgi:hypothetical protein